MKKILIVLILLCLSFTIIGCGGNSSDDPYSEYKDFVVFDKDIPISYIIDENNDITHTWKGDMIESSFGQGKKIEVKEPNQEPEYYAYINNKTGVYYGFEEEGKYFFTKVYDFSKTKIGDVWDSDEFTSCEIIDRDPYFKISTIKMTEKSTGAYVVYEYSEFFKLIYNLNQGKMKIILFKNPKFLSSLLRIIQNIKEHNK